MAATPRLIVISPWHIDEMRHNEHHVIGTDITSIEPGDTVLLYLPATAESIERSITLLALLKRKQQPLLLVSDRCGAELVAPVLRSLKAQLLNYFPTDSPKEEVRDIIGVFLQSGLLDLV